MIPEVQDRDGALYADVTPTSLGLPVYTPMCHIPIPYSIYWKQFGKSFEEQAKATCPVDTGYLRDHIGYHTDPGGCEIWSDAPYSAYQEYGTSRMKAQPYFEAALATLLMWERCTRCWTPRLRVRTWTLALPFLVNHLQPHKRRFSYAIKLCKITIFC